MSIKKDLKIYSANPLYLVFDNVEKLMKISKKQRKNKKSIKVLWIKIRDLSRSLTKKFDDYDEKYMKIKFDSDGNLPLNKTIEVPIVTMGIKAVFMKITNIIHKIF